MKIDRDWLKEVLSNVATYGQMGFSIVVPPVVLCLIGFFLNKRFGIGAWIIAVAIILGLVCAFLTIYKYVRYFLVKNTNDDDKNSIISYRKHF